MKQSTWARIFGWLGSTLTAAGAAHALGKWSAVAVALGPLLMGYGVHAGAGTDGQR